MEKPPKFDMKYEIKGFIAMGCIVAVVFFYFAFFTGLFTGNGGEAPKKEKKSRTVDLQASATIRPPNLVLKNNDSFNWTDIEVEMNDAYKRRCSFIPAGQEFFTALNSLTKKDGTRSIFCRQNPRMSSSIAKRREARATGMGNGRKGEGAWK